MTLALSILVGTLVTLWLRVWWGWRDRKASRQWLRKVALEQEAKQDE